MRKIEKILVPIDFSECAWAVLTQAAFWARTHAAELHFLNIWRVPWYLDEYALAPVGATGQTVGAIARARASWAMEEFVSVLGKEKGLSLRTTVTSGTPRNAILELAELGDHDLIIMGTHGRTGLAHLFLGSTAEGVVRRAPCPVLTVRGGSQHAEEVLRVLEAPPPLPAVSLRRILVPVDFSGCSAAALDHAVALGRAFDASIDVLHVVAPPHCSAPIMPGELSVEGQRWAEFVVRDAQERLAALLQPTHETNPVVRSRIVRGSPPDEILSAAKEYDLVVVGTHGRKGLSRFFLGSVAEQIVRRSPRPVLTIRSADSDSRN